jgi:hypothetical protein
MAEAVQIMKTLTNRVDAMLRNAEFNNQPGLKQQLEEIGFLLEMLEPKLPPMDEQL